LAEYFAEEGDLEELKEQLEEAASAEVVDEDGHLVSFEMTR
jgi:hypothetical protein